MTIALVRFYLFANLLVVLAAALLPAVGALSARLPRPIAYRQQLRLGCALILGAVVAPWLALPTDNSHFVPAMTQVWAAPSMSDVGVSASRRADAMVSAGSTGTHISLDLLAQVIGAAVLIGAVVGLVRIFTGARTIRRVLARAQLVRRAGTLRVLSSDEVDIPFSCWVPGVCYIVVPSALILRPRDLRIGLRHEAQHHRHGDTRVVYALEFLRGVFLLNPLMPVLLNQIRSLQEFACDEALVRAGCVPAHEYCECLVRVARGAMRGQRPVSCLHMADVEGESMLARRVAAVLEAHRERLGQWKAAALNGAALLALLATGIGLSSAIHDRRVSLAEAQKLASAARAGSAFPIVVNEQVLTELNRFLGTPDGRRFMRDGLQRMGTHEDLITAQLTRHALPRELLAVPLVESGYRNLAQGPDARHGAGIWMFIEPTARRFGLTVEDAQDQRLDVASETEAAMRMFSTLHAEFDDWSFALLAYNGGSDLVRRAVRDTGATDAFRAAEHGYENDPRYVARVTAAVIVLKNSKRLQLR